MEYIFINQNTNNKNVPKNGSINNFYNNSKHL